MAYNRLYQSGFENGPEGATYYELTNIANGDISNEVIISVVGIILFITRTGTYHFRTHGACGSYISFQTCTQLRSGMGISHQRPPFASGETPEYFAFADGSTSVISVVHNSSDVDIYCGSTLVASYEDSYFNLGSGYHWHEIGIDFKIHATDGWIKFYRRGVERLAYTGKTDHGGSSVDRMYLGSVTPGQTWDDWLRFDDIYIDDTTGEIAPDLPPNLYFFLIRPTSNGASSQWTGSDGNSTNNFQLIDEVGAINTTDWLQVAASNLRDSYGCSDLGNLSPYTIIDEELTVEALIPVFIARKEDPASTLTLSLTQRYNSVYQDSSGRPLTSTYKLIFDRQDVAPDGSTWTLAIANATEIGIKSV